MVRTFLAAIESTHPQVGGATAQDSPHKIPIRSRGNNPAEVLTSAARSKRLYGAKRMLSHPWNHLLNIMNKFLAHELNLGAITDKYIDLVLYITHFIEHIGKLFNCIL